MRAEPGQSAAVNAAKFRPAVAAPPQQSIPAHHRPPAHHQAPRLRPQHGSEQAQCHPQSANDGGDDNIFCGSPITRPSHRPAWLSRWAAAAFCGGGPVLRETVVEGATATHWSASVGIYNPLPLRNKRPPGAKPAKANALPATEKICQRSDHRPRGRALNRRSAPGTITVARLLITLPAKAARP